MGRCWSLAAVLLGISTIAGCGLVPEPLTDDVVDGNRDPRATSPIGKTSGEPNNGFSDAIVAVFDEAHSAQLQGVIDSRFDLDVYNLGPLAGGDRIIVEVQTSSDVDSLDSSIALFDAEENLFIANDDHGSSLDSMMDDVVRFDSEAYYLVIGSSSGAFGVNRSGAYRIDITVVPDQPIPPAKGQTVFLDFDGGSVSADNLGVNFVTAFDAKDIDPLYEGRTEQIKDVIIETVRQNFQAHDLTVITSDDTDSPAPPFSAVLFGGFSLSAFGISAGVDSFNANDEDMAVIFTESFSPDVFFLPPPTAQELGVAIGNVATHEIGHLVGLHHVTDPQRIMDAASPADTFLFDQEFGRAPLSEDVMPIGAQDALLLLAEILGLL